MRRRGHGEGSIYRRADGLWCASVSLGRDARGRRLRKVVCAQTRKKVAAKLQRLLSQADDGIVSKRLSVAAFLSQWLSSRKDSLEDSSYERYVRSVRSLSKYLGLLQVSRLTTSHVEQLYADMAKAGASVSERRYAGKVLHGAMRYAVRLKLLRANPCHDAERPKAVEAELNVWSAEQVQAFWRESAAHRLHALFVTAIGTGMREGELFGLDWPDVDFAHGCLSVQRTLQEVNGHLRLKSPKTASARRRIDLPAFVVDALHEHRKRMLAEGLVGGPVFCDTRGGRLRRSNLREQVFLPIARRAGLPRIRFHDLRHTAATLLFAAGEAAKVVSERLGHSDIGVTQRTYLHVLPTMQRAAAERLDAVLGPTRAALG